MTELFIKRDVPFELYDVNLKDASDEDMLEIGRETDCGLSLDEIKRIRDHFRDNEGGRNPTDIEFQALGQAWSEHSCYKTSKPILKGTVFDIDAPQNILVIKEDAGVVEFDDDHAYVVALESHNHPSAIEPYGGAATGIGGIVRDVVCMGAQPVAFVDPLFFGSLGYEYSKLPKGIKHPKYLLKGVVSGIRDYGNRIGIPTIAGMTVFHNGYLGNCLVNVGCVGIARKDLIIRSRVKHSDDIFIALGGRTGRDGIHGVTFASADLHEDSEAEDIGAVQLGDPITKEPVIHACLEMNEKGILNGMKDFGGGGISSCCGEMALAGGYGAVVDLEKLPLKEEGLAPWEIWISESQERMMVAVSPDMVDAALEVCSNWDVEANVVGHVKPGKRMEIFFHREKIFDIDMDFYSGGPVYNRPYEFREIPHRDELPDLPELSVNADEKGPDTPSDPVPETAPDFTPTLLKLMGDENIASKAYVVRQYDHEVRGNTVIKPLQGKLGYETHGDASVIKPVEDSWKGLAMTSDVNPFFMELDPYRGALSAVDETCRNLVAVGARPHSLADCLNYGNPQRPDRLGDFVKTAEAFGKICRHLSLPLVSGNVSFYNEAHSGPIPPTPTLLGCGIAPDIRNCVTVDLKCPGDALYLIGETRREMGGSAYYRMTGTDSSVVPDVDFDSLKNGIDALLESIGGRLLAACHDVGEGGLGVSLAEMCIGGDLGACVDISVHAPDLRRDLKLFSESNTRWLAEVRQGKETLFESILKRHGVPFLKLGSVSKSEIQSEKESEKESCRLIIFDGPGMAVNATVDALRREFESFPGLVG